VQSRRRRRRRYHLRFNIPGDAVQQFNTRMERQRSDGWCSLTKGKTESIVYPHYKTNTAKAIITGEKDNA